MRHLKLETTTVFGKILVRVVQQTHYQDRFTEEGTSFLASNGFVLQSYKLPAVGENKMFVRGSDSDKFDVIMLEDGACGRKWLKDCCVAVKEYNIKYADKTCSKADSAVEIIE